MFQLDARTAVFINFIYTLSFSLLIFFASRFKDYRFKGVNNWVLAFLLISLNFLIISFKSMIPAGFIFIIPHFMVLWAYIEIKRGLCLFYSIKNRIFTDFIFSGMFLFLLIVNDSDARLRIVTACIFSILIFLDTILLFSKREVKIQIKSNIIPTLYIIASVIMAVRLFIGFQWNPADDPLDTGNSLSIISILFFLTNIVIFFVLLSIVVTRILSERNELILELREASLTDDLTGLMNRRGFKNIIIYEVKRFSRSKKGFAFVYCDIDHFKHVNDKYGHDCGDYVLKLLSKTLIDSLRSVDTSARWGGEEFVLLLPETALEQAGILVERIRQDIESMDINYNEYSFNITMSFGVTHTNTSEIELNDIIKRADENLFEAKNSGRNRVVMSEIY